VQPPQSGQNCSAHAAHAAVAQPPSAAGQNAQRTVAARSRALSASQCGLLHTVVVVVEGAAAAVEGAVMVAAMAEKKSGGQRRGRAKI